MLETYVGEEIFRTGVQAYMKRYAYRNAVTEDLWAEIEGAGSKKITGIADDFTKQPGVPLVTVDSVVPAWEPCHSCLEARPLLCG